MILATIGQTVTQAQAEYEAKYARRKTAGRSRRPRRPRQPPKQRRSPRLRPPRLRLPPAAPPA